MINGPQTYKALAEALPYELQSALLQIRDDGATAATMPQGIFIALTELTLIEMAQTDTEALQLSKLGAHLVDFCTC